jgi:ribosome-binding protein aMBF1 (putative translation factor)
LVFLGFLLENVLETMNKIKDIPYKNRMDQDWNPVILRGATRTKAPTKSSFISHQHAKDIKLEQDEMVVEKQTNRDLRSMIQRKRIEMGLSQKQLATRMNEPEHIVKDIEGGKLLSPKPHVVLKLKKILNMSFRLS